ncbi:urease accessory protein UreD [Mesorhizobium sp. CAU 1732]|uniref:urease accessory protein UreD n=1 Tax=Mesorhizobium sp. CAU 1732 TaxID=3140358 RepID=UPI003261B5C0
MTITPMGIQNAAMQRVAGHGELAVRQRSGRTRIERLFQEGAAKIRLPTTSGDPLEAILINTAGGLTGGDRIAWTIEAEREASVVVTTQACEKVYRSAGGHAEATCRISVGTNARVAWLPQETIVYNRSAFRRTLDVDIVGDGSALLLEATVFGRQAMGEFVDIAEFRDRWRVRVDGHLVHAEAFSIGPDVARQLAIPAVGGGARAVATLLLVGPDAEHDLDAARHILGDAGGVSAWRVGGTGKLLARLVAADSYSLRARLIPLVRLLNGRAGLPKTWSL